ncbi:MAG TPA: hypothetical protein VJ124_02325 [Pyrinomonadaceae bacterium]|nr:hypothetical protein [Pyrinomonadaceae bacterium]
MKTRLRSLLLSALFLAGTVTSFSAQEKHFKRVEGFPPGEQTNDWIGSFMSGVKDANVEQYTFEAPYERVWGATLRATEVFGTTGGRPRVAVDASSGRIQNGRISQDATVGMGATAWMDEFVVEVVRLTQALTRVAVMRKVVEKQISGDRPWKTVWSNGKIERWILTQIEDELANEGVDFKKSALGKYVKEKKPKDYIELKPDGTFHLYIGGKDSEGQYEVAGRTLALVQGKKVTQLKLQANAIVDGTGKRWIKEGGMTQTTALATTDTATNRDGNAQGEVVDYSRSAPGKYVNRDNSTEYFELKPDGTFYLQESGTAFAGRYEVRGDVITGVLPNGMKAKGKMRGNTITDEGGKTWVKIEDAPTSGVPPASSNASAASSGTPTEVLTNENILRMVEAKLPDSVVIAKIRNSKSKFDTSADGLIKLKQAGVSDAVIQVMAESVPK